MDNEWNMKAIIIYLKHADAELYKTTVHLEARRIDLKSNWEKFETQSTMNIL